LEHLSLWHGAGEEDLRRGTVVNAVEGKLTLIVFAKLEEEFATIVTVGIDNIYQFHLRILVEMGFVCSGGEEHGRLAVDVDLGDEGDIATLRTFPGGVRGIDESGTRVIGKFKAGEFFIRKDDGVIWCRWWRGGLVRVGDGWRGDRLHGRLRRHHGGDVFLCDGLQLGLQGGEGFGIGPVIDERVRVAIGRIGDGDALLHLNGFALELGIGSGIGAAGGFAAMEHGAVGIVTELGEIGFCTAGGGIAGAIVVDGWRRRCGLVGEVRTVRIVGIGRITVAGVVDSPGVRGGAGVIAAFEDGAG